MMYTIKQINEAGRLISDNAAAAIEEQVFAASVYMLKWQQEHPYVPPTRRQLWMRRLRDYRGRIALAVEVLRGEHECDDPDW